MRLRYALLTAIFSCTAALGAEAQVVDGDPSSLSNSGGLKVHQYSGAPQQESNFTDLSKALEALISKKRPEGGPKQSVDFF